MSNNLGFKPADNQEYYFVSYNSPDALRVQNYAQELNRRGLPLWYDDGIDLG